MVIVYCLEGETVKSREYVYLIEADARLRSNCMQKLVELYGENIPEDILSRVLEELSVVQEKKDSDILLYFEMICTILDVNKGEILVRGNICSLYIAYLLEITNINPMDLNMAISPEYLNDESYHLEVNICIPDICRQRLHSLLKELEGVDRLVKISDYISDGAKDCGVRLERLLILPNDYSFDKNTGCRVDDDELIITSVPIKLDCNLIKIEVHYTQGISMLNALVQVTGESTRSISYTDCDNCSIFNIYDENNNDETYADELEGWLDIPGVESKKAYLFKHYFEIKSFSDLVKAIGLMYGSNIWFNNGRLRLMNGDSLEDLITCREDIYDYLRNKGISSEDAHNIVRFVCIGRTRALVLNKNYNTWQSYEKILKEHDVDGIYIESLRKISFVMQRAYLTSMAAIIWQLGYYKSYYPYIYRDIYKKYAINGAHI